MKLFKIKTKDEMTNSLAAFMPSGRIFSDKDEENTTLRKYLTGLAIELFRIDEQMNVMSEDYDINLTTEFIDQWESAVGIPDNCFNSTNDIDERRQNVLTKLARMNLTTEQDFIDLAALYGFNITVESGFTLGSHFTMTFPITLSGKEDRFTMIVTFETTLETFPLTFPIPFGETGISLVQCLFNRLKPANVKIIYQ